MTEYLFDLLSLLLTEAEIFAAVFVLLSRFDGRSNFALRIALMTAGCVAFNALATLVCFYMPQTADLWEAGIYVFQAVIAVLSAWFCFNASFREIVFAGSVAIAIEHIALQATRTICLLAGLYDTPFADHIINACIFAAVLTVAVLIFRRIRQSGADSDVGRASVFLFPVSLAVTATIGFVGLIIADFGIIYAIVVSVCGIFYGAFMLFAESAFLVSRHSEEELSVIRSLWNEDRKHYEMQKESMEMINIKCHDLRHQIRRLRESDSPASKRAMEEIENSIYVYDSMFRTGSEVLDVILSDYSLRCRKSEVQLTCMADGGKISFMDEMDVYSLFGNMLENALEYEQTVSDKEKRFISLTVRSENDGVRIHAENHYEGDAVTGEPGGTSKKDKSNHGFGIKSMKKIVEKYNGKTDILIADDMFQVDILLPARNGNGGKE